MASAGLLRTSLSNRLIETGLSDRLKGRGPGSQGGGNDDDDDDDHGNDDDDHDDDDTVEGDVESESDDGSDGAWDQKENASHFAQLSSPAASSSSSSRFAPSPRGDGLGSGDNLDASVGSPWGYPMSAVRAKHLTFHTPFHTPFYVLSYTTFRCFSLLHFLFKLLDLPHDPFSRLREPLQLRLLASITSDAVSAACEALLEQRGGISMGALHLRHQLLFPLLQEFVRDEL
jgi:hypothetical protein